MSAHLVVGHPNETGGIDFKTVEPTAAQKAQIAELKKEFDKCFGVDQESRTLEQWRNLVGKYGMDMVKHTEKMSEKQIKKKMRG